MSLPYALIIAGGHGQRLGGVRKADLRLGGVRQLDRVMKALGTLAAPILVATGPRGRSLALPPDCVSIADGDSPCAGPLAGLVAAVAHLAESGTTRGLLISVAVDTPFLPGDFVSRMVAGIGDTNCAYATWGDDFYPPNALWRLESLQTLPAAVSRPDAPTSLKALQRNLGAVGIDWSDLSPANPFANINTLAELIRLQRLASQQA